MLYIITVCLLLLLAIVVLQDFKERHISWVLIPLLLGSFFAQGVLLLPLTDLLHYMALNLSFILLQLLILTVYISVKQKRPVNIINSHLGIGDVLFFITVAVAFSPINFIVFYITGLVFTLICFVVFKRLSENSSAEIPLAGLMAAVMIALILIQQWIPKFSFYNDDLLTGWLIK